MLNFRIFNFFRYNFELLFKIYILSFTFNQKSALDLRGDRIAVYMPIRTEWEALYYGIIQPGAVAV